MRIVSIFKPRTLFVACLLAVGLLPSVWSVAHAQSTTIVALGASNTRGWGVSPSQAWPARLEAMLKAKGVSATVINAGVDGNTSADMLARLDSAVPPGTQIVVLQAFFGNDLRQGLTETVVRANVARIKARLAARKVTLVISPLAHYQALGKSNMQADGVHITAAGHARLATMVLPQVLAAIRK